MSGSINEVTLMGHLGADPDIRATQAGKKVANFRMATSKRWKDKDSGEDREHTEWHSVVIFNEGLAGVVEKYLKKGSKVQIRGELQTRKWTHSDGGDRYSTEVVLNGFDAKLYLLDSQPGNRPPAATSPDDYGKQGVRSGGGNGANAPLGERTPPPAEPPNRDFDDEIPF